MRSIYFLTLAGVFLFSNVKAQSDTTAAQALTLQQCISLALENQPEVQQSVLDELAGERDIKGSLTGWMPQINASANFNHYLELPTSVFPSTTGEKQLVQVGVYNSSGLLLEARQVLFNNDVLFNSRTARYRRKQFSQNTESVKINTVVSVSKAFYDILTSQEQLNILQEVISREEKQVSDARSQYEAGVVDPTDYKRATIALNNSRADLKRISELLKYKYAYLKQLLGQPSTQNYRVVYDNKSMEQEMFIDTAIAQGFENRIELKQLETQRQLQRVTTNYYKWSFIPTASAFINRNLAWQNDDFSELYKQSFPNSQFGVSLVIPIFQSTRRIQYLKREKILAKKLDLEVVNVKNQISTQLELALANYKSNLNSWKTAQANVQLSQEVYETLNLQYIEGVKTYLEIMIAETDLRTSQINYLNALFNVLASKLDVQQALGTVNINQ
jgi:outer membrane protein